MKAAEFYAANRGGGLATMIVSQRIGAYCAVLFARLGLPPTAMTLLNLVLGLTASLLVVVTAPGRVATVEIGLIAMVLWHIAYGLDCGDGQLARVTKTGSAAGARLDILCDLAIQAGFVAALSTVANEYCPSVPVWLYAAFGGTFVVNMVASILQQNDSQAASLISSSSLPVRMVKMIRDYAFMITVAGATLMLAPELTIWIVAVLTSINAAFLLASIFQAGRAALRR